MFLSFRYIKIIPHIFRNLFSFIVLLSDGNIQCRNSKASEKSFFRKQSLALRAYDNLHGPFNRNFYFKKMTVFYLGVRK